MFIIVLLLPQAIKIIWYNYIVLYNVHTVIIVALNNVSSASSLTYKVGTYKHICT